MVRTKEECTWCMSTPHIERKICEGMPEEFKHRCSACHELYWEQHRECDNCTNIIDTEKPDYHYDAEEHTYTCSQCQVTKIVLSPAEFDKLTEMLNNPPEPTEALRKLMRGE